MVGAAVAELQLEGLGADRPRADGREVVLSGTRDVGGRRDEFRYGYRLWLDDETAMPLMSSRFISISPVCTPLRTWMPSCRAASRIATAQASVDRVRALRLRARHEYDAVR